jgi:hypothetical protein
MKPANQYASTTPIPDWFESEIIKLNADDTAHFISDLGLALHYGEWDMNLGSIGLSSAAYEWLESQDRVTFKALLKWVSMELID